MTYQEFKNNTLHAISTKLGPSYRIALQDIIKNNDTHLDGLTILSENSNISPTIYLNYYYDQYLAGKSLSCIYEDIMLSYREHAPKESIDISFFTDFTKVKNRIVFKLVNYDRNKDLLSKVPHIRYLDLAIIFNCFVESLIDGYATILIYHHHLSYWNISTEELYHLAMKNTPRLLPYHLQNMNDILVELLNTEQPDWMNETFEPIPMYVLSNISKLHGSGCILYEDLLFQISQSLDSDFYILPSSIHEVLLIPVEHANSYAELSSMVREINNTQLSREEVLSDRVYFYSRHTGKVSL